MATYSDHREVSLAQHRAGRAVLGTVMMMWVKGRTRTWQCRRERGGRVGREEDRSGGRGGEGRDGH